uniref:MTSS I-BAR domain containing 2a n=1 Tax=Tetraodon nigroviridis TaxID=99883 RepID=H3CSG5_TETNG
METVEKECGALGGLFQAIVNDMKSSYPVWEDFCAKATKLHSQLRTTILAAVAFLDAFQKVADMATNSRGATRDVGSALTRMCMRHRSIEAKLRHFTNALLEGLVTPLQDRIEEWKKTANQLDKDHAKEYKRSRQEIKRKSLDTMKLQKKARKGRGNLRPQLDSAMQDVSDLYLLMEETEKQAVRRALLEERGRYCTFINMLQPVVNIEIAMLGEVTHLQAIVDDLTVLTEDPHKLPPASEQVIRDLKGSDYSWSYQTPPSSPSSTGSRKSSMCRSLMKTENSCTSQAVFGSTGNLFNDEIKYTHYLPGNMPSAGAHRLSSVSSHDSGFVSQDANTHSKPPSPMPSDITSQASETCQSVSECSSPTAFGSCSSFGTFRPAFSHTGTIIRPLSVILPASPTFKHSPGSNTPSPTSKVPSWKDWAKSSSCETSLASTLQRRRESVDKMKELEAPPSPQGQSDDPHRARAGPGSVAAKHGEPLSPAASTLAMVLTRGLSMEQQKSSRDSLQYSSGYSTQTNTPSCSEDTIPSQGSDYECYSLNGDADNDGQADFDKSSTIPRHSNIAQSYRRMIQTKRPASTAGLPAGASSTGAISSGTATIRRTPSSKTGVRRTPSTSGPIPIRPPIVPVKTPTVPDSPGYASPSRHCVGSEDLLFSDDAAAGGGIDRLVESHQGAGAAAQGAEEDPLLAANRHSLVEKIGELAANAHALGEGQYPTGGSQPGDSASLDPLEASATTKEGRDMLVLIRRGVRLRKTVTDDRSAPRIL